ncbi:unnamed protein product, partial [marine sediment metagenome]
PTNDEAERQRRLPPGPLPRREGENGNGDRVGQDGLA